MKAADSVPPDQARDKIMRAAAHEFARRPFGDVNLDDILARAGVTKGAMYFHFRSKYALALSVIEEQRGRLTTAVIDLYARKLSGLETLIEVSFLVAAEDINYDLMRAALSLVEQVGMDGGLRANLFEEWIKHFAVLGQQAIVEGDVSEAAEAEDISRMLVALYIGTRATSNLDLPEQYLGNVEKAWAVALSAFAQPAKLDYFTQFIRRRTALAIKNSSARLATGTA